jgi:hypothetical protein
MENSNSFLSNLGLNSSNIYKGKKVVVWAYHR